MSRNGGTTPAEPLLDVERPPQMTRTLSGRPPSLEQRVGHLGRLLFAWFTPLVNLAVERDQANGKLETTDLYPLMQQDLAEVQMRRLEKEWQEELRRPKPSLTRAMSRAYRWEVAGTAWIKLINDVGHFIGPVLLNRIILFVKEGTEHDGLGYIYALGMLLSSAVQALAMAHYFQRGYRTGMRLRAGLILLAYRKALKILTWESNQPQEQQAAPAQPAAQPSRFGRMFRRRRAAPSGPPPASGGGGIGNLTNLISADTDRFLLLMPYFNLIWSAPLQMILCFVMLTMYVSWALVSGVVVMVLLTTLSGWVQNRARMVQKEAMKLKDTRLKTEVEMLKIVKIIKFYAWENTIEDRVKTQRDTELAAQLKYKLWSTGIFLTFSLSPSLVALSTFASYTLLLGKDLGPEVAFTALSLFNILTFPLGAMPMMARFFMEAKVSADRIETFLLRPEVAPRPSPPVDSSVALELNAGAPATLTWPDSSVLLKDVSLSVRKGEFLVVVGRTGTGKSGLLSALLGELPLPSNGKLAVIDSIGYCAQTAWVRNATLRDNVLCGGTDESRYQAVLDACALRADLESLPNGDQTLIGDRGINLSGGQKQRVAIARAVYSESELLILDDVLSALDSHVAAHICKYLFGGPLLKGKTVVLVTHSKRALPLAHKVLALGEEKDIIFYGTYEGFLASGKSESTEDASEQNKEETAAPATEEPPKTNESKGADEKDGKGKDEKDIKAPVAGKKQEASRERPVQQEDRRSGAVSLAVYRAYASACGGCAPVCVFVLAVASGEGLRNVSDAYLAHWSNSGGFAEGLGIYSLCVLGVAVGGLFYVMSRIFLGQHGSKTLHDRCVHTLLRAKMTFHDLTPSGQIINRLAEDTNTLDYTLPQTMGANFVWYWRSASIVVICMFVGWYLVFLIIPMFVVYSRLAKRFLPATRDLRRLDSVARSPIFHHFGETMNGLTTIRAMGQQERMFLGNVARLEAQMEAYYLSNTAARWLSLRLQFNGTILLGAVSGLGVFMSSTHSMSAGILGLAITYAMKLTDTLNQVNRESADRETNMVSVERIYHYAKDVQQEAALVLPSDRTLPPSWPSQGDVNVDGLTMRYREGLPTVLNNISLDIRAGERIGVVGRTGCGKSSLLLTLMRLAEAEGGRVLVDNVDVKTLGLHTLRSKAAIIPQDPAILPGTVRYNLDPFSSKSDAELWEALEKAQLRRRIESTQEGLDSIVEEGGSNYSVGELQLLCLARALLRRQQQGGLLLLDEATSALDAETDQIIQKVIRQDFHCTTITIAHRIQTLMDYDRVIVLEEGRVAEVGNPQELVKQPTSTFRSLAQQGGVSVSSPFFEGTSS